MNNRSKKVFITNYIMSLNERTRKEKSGVKVGFDWIIYNLALYKDWTPVRLPFFREPEGHICKTEAEIGVDLSFLTPDKEELIIFTLKDERLNNTNWNSHKFLSDLEMACMPDLSSDEFASVKTVKVILAYNKDEDETGKNIFVRFKTNNERKIARGADLIIERWNLSRIEEEVESYLLTPDLLPQHLTGLLAYISQQSEDFKFGTTEWENLLIPNWQNFLNIILSEPLDEKKIKLIPVTLYILAQNIIENPSFYPAWIDLIEWAMLSLWDCCLNKLGETEKDIELKGIIINIWLNLYINELEIYFLKNQKAIVTEHGLHTRRAFLYLDSINDAYVTYWHIARLGILNLGAQEYLGETVEEKALINKLILRSADWLTALLRNNPAAFRPLIDLNHIELFIIWLIFWQSNNQQEMYLWLSELETRLLTRRGEKTSIPFIEGGNRLNLVAEYIALSVKPTEYLDTSSYLLLMILEICCSLDNEEQRNSLLKRYYERIILGNDMLGNKLFDTAIDLLSWVPPKDWHNRVLKESVTDGVAITVGYLQDLNDDNLDIVKKLTIMVEEIRNKHKWEWKQDIPNSIYILACIKNKCPLPPEFWRSTIFSSDI